MKEKINAEARSCGEKKSIEVQICEVCTTCKGVGYFDNMNETEKDSIPFVECVKCGGKKKIERWVTVDELMTIMQTPSNSPLAGGETKK